MMPSKKQLIVEGYFDKLFFGALLRSMGVDDVDVKMPQSAGASYGGKGNAISVFYSALGLLNDGSIENLALIVDADFVEISSQGFRNTLKEINKQLDIKDFKLKTMAAKYKNGLIYRKDSLGIDVAVWIMPDNSSDGYLEYMLFNALHEKRSLIATEATTIVSGLKNKEYAPHHERKAKLAVAMAMLENPGRNISHLIESDILDHNNNSILKDFIEFLKQFYK
jgi:hypothetical protein